MIVTTPAKVILSGEHSVVYGAPALGVPLGLFLHSRWSDLADGGAIRFSFQGRQVEIAPSWESLREKLAAFRARYASFKEGGAEIRSVLPQPHDLATLTLAVFHERFSPGLPGLAVAIDTEIPVSSGLGSSSSLILNLLQGLLKRSGKTMPQDELLECARGIEDFQHGSSSGLDLALVSARQPLVYVRGRGVIENVAHGHHALSLVHSGTPAVSTGQCVAQVRARFANDEALWADFAACTQAIRKAFGAGDAAGLKDSVMINQSLLEKIGVVPEKVRSFVVRCRAEGVAAKICGAGAVAGESAGMIWALADDEKGVRALESAVREYGYDHGRYAITV